MDFVVMADRTCDECGKTFGAPYLLKRHRRRKTPCSPIVDRDQLPLEERSKPFACRFCNRRFSQTSNLYSHMKHNCQIAGSETGMQLLYEHTLKKQLEQQIQKNEAQEARLRLLEERLSRVSMAQPAGGRRPPPLANSHLSIGTINQANTFNNTININFFGGEDTSHVTPQNIRALLDGITQSHKSSMQAALSALLETATMIYSDPSHPENLTCYLPNKTKDDVMVHREAGWEIQPYSLVLPPMVSKSIETLFANQPFENAERYGDLMIALRDNEEAFQKGKQMRTILVRSKSLLERALGALPSN